MKNHPNDAFTCKASQQAISTEIFDPIETMFKYDNETDQQAHLDFTMDISVIRCSETNRIQVITVLADWNAWFTEPLNVIRRDELKELSAVVLYHVSTALVRGFTYPF